MDAFVRKYIRHNLSYRFVILPDGKAASDLEAAIQGGKWGLVDRFSTQENDRSPAEVRNRRTDRQMSRQQAGQAKC